MKRMRFFALLLALFTFHTFYAQIDTLTFINGKVFSGKVLRLSQDSIVFKLHNKKTQTIEKFRVYAIDYEEGKRQLIYFQDSSSGRDYSVKEMGSFIKGEQDAFKYHKTFFPFAFSTALSATGAYFLGGENFMVLAVPFVSAPISMLILRPKIRKEFITDKSLLKDESYRDGYRRVAKIKKNKQIFLGSLIGTIAGVVIQKASK